MIIRLTDIERNFQVGEQVVRALQEITLDVAPGEYLSIMGPSGSGNSTLLNIIGLLDRPTSGEYRLEGNDVTNLSDAEMARSRREKIGFIFQFFHLVPRLTAAENIELPLLLAGVPPPERQTHVEQLLAVYNLVDRASHRPDQLSGGQRQRVAIARSVVMGPEILLADEPTGNLDRTSGREVIDLLESLNHQGKTLLVVTHDPSLGTRAPRQLKMVDGRIVDDTRKETL